MKHAEITKELQDRFHTINKSLKKILPHFDKDIVHKTTIELIKLHAFLELLSAETGDSDQLRIRRRLKSFYGYIGIILDIQLQLQYINSILPQQAPPGIEIYMAELHAEMESWKKEIISLTSDQMDFDEEKDIILSALPPKLSKAAIGKFLNSKANEIRTLLILRPKKEHDLHALRKLFKNILYNWNYIRSEAESMLPENLNTYDNMHIVAELLDLYGDRCTSLDFLQPVYTGKVKDEAAIQFFQSARLQLEKQKEELKNEFFVLLLRLQGVSLQNAECKLLS